MPPPLLAFDLDGTLFDTTGADYENPESLRANCRPIPEAVQRVQRAAEYGWRIAYVTGRAEHVRGLTLVQLAVAGLPAGALVMNKKWEGYEKMAEYKGIALDKLGASVYIGDHAADRDAARFAGIPFVHADEFRSGQLDPDPRWLGLARV